MRRSSTPRAPRGFSWLLVVILLIRVRVERLHEHLVQGALLQPVERVGGVHIPILLLALHVVRARASDDRLRSGEGNTQMAMIKL